MMRPVWLTASLILGLFLAAPANAQVVVTEGEPGRLVVKTKPDDAAIFVDGVQRGYTPLDELVAPGHFNLRIRRRGYVEVETSVQVFPHGEKWISAVLKPLPNNPYKVWGHVAFWSGLVLSGLGGGATWQANATAQDYAAGDRSAWDANEMWSSLSWTGYSLGGALMITGVVLWILSPGDRAWYRTHFEGFHQPDLQVAPVPFDNREW
jgi:hypothetical protein